MLEYLERLSNSESLAEVWALHCKAMNTYGFDRLIYGFTRFRTKNSIGPIDDTVLLSNHDPDYFGPFISQEMYKTAPMTRWAAENTGACSWSWLARDGKSLTPEELKVIAFNHSKQVFAGYTISFGGPASRARGAIALTAKTGLSQDRVDAIWQEHGRTIETMNNMAHLKIISLPNIGLRKNLSERQREVLEWVGDGKTTQDIATILGLTTATVEKHLRLARERLDVDTTAQAVLKASLQNQMYILKQ